MLMKPLRLLFATVFWLSTFSVFGQTMTITNPVLTAPYQVTAGTQVTFEWDAFSTPPNDIFTSSSLPSVSNFVPPSSSWTSNSGFTANPNGTYSITLTINNDTWIWGGLSGFIGWQYSNVIEIQAISSYTISATDTLICATGGSSTLSASTGAGYTYQWYQDTSAIAGANNATYVATTPGNYQCVITINGTPNSTNTITIASYSATYTGNLSGNQVTMTADQTFSGYQWYKRIGTGNATAIAGANTNNYTATIDNTQSFYYYEGTINGCTVQSSERLITDTLFVTPVLNFNATANSQGYYCSGNTMYLEVTNLNGIYDWYKNNTLELSGTQQINVWGTYQNGNWYASYSPIGWPEISINSNTENVSVTDLIAPNLSGANFNNYFCDGDQINLILTDEGYNYTWYLYDTSGVYGPSHVISVPNGVYQHTFNGSKYITVEAEFNGCSKTTTLYLQSASDQTLSVQADNYNQLYLCTDSTVNIGVASWMVSDFHSFQWHELVNGNWNVLPNDTNSSLAVSLPGEFMVTAVPNSCSTATVSSDTFTVHSYLDRQPSIWTNQNQICEGETVTLNLSGSSSWYAMQWQEADIVLGQGGYEYSFIGLLNNSASDTQNVDQLGTYRISAKHVSCPNGLKTKSEPIQIQPKFTAKVIVVDSFAVEPKHIVAWDSTDHVIGCVGQPVRLTLTETDFDSIYWYDQLYAGDDDYALGTFLGLGDTVYNTMDARFVSAIVVDSTGCRSTLTPMLLDGYAFQTPGVTSYNNAELCEPGDSTILHLAFQGTWIEYRWYKDGIAIPNSDNDSLVVYDTGGYTLSGFPELCPSMEFNSGLPVQVNYLYAEIWENNDELYAMPELGWYWYQWFFNGDSIDAPLPNTPWIFPKDSLQPGEYTVSVSNGKCDIISAVYNVDPNGVIETIQNPFDVFPNPVHSELYINGDYNEQNTYKIYDLRGVLIMQGILTGSDVISVNHLTNGMYIIQLQSDNDVIQQTKFIKK